MPDEVPAAVWEAAAALFVAVCDAEDDVLVGPGSVRTSLLSGKEKELSVCRSSIPAGLRDALFDQNSKAAVLFHKLVEPYIRPG